MLMFSVSFCLFAHRCGSLIKAFSCLFCAPSFTSLVLEWHLFCVFPAAGNLWHLIVEACIARKLIDTSAYFWPGYVSAPCNQLPHSIPNNLPSWSSLMKGSPLTPQLVNVLVATPASRYSTASYVNFVHLLPQQEVGWFKQPTQMVLFIHINKSCCFSWSHALFARITFSDMAKLLWQNSKY